ncbi:MAG: ATP-dependent sacrificial sulfur transferase LarE [Planctomycetota bacterium]|nr:ATP-dependent sacrificial sulfur transferase LarE [Planctomycetota bacterium]
MGGAAESASPDSQLPEPSVLEALGEWLHGHRPVVVALSGGVDSAVMASLAFEYLQSDAVAVTGVSPSLSSEEQQAARVSSQAVGIRHLEVNTEELSRPGYRANRGDRCYHCKSELYDVILSVRELQEHTILDGAQASDESGDRPGMKASGERGVESPLRIFGIDKTQVRALARQRGLPSWDRPARPCLASRVPVGTEVDSDLLKKVEALETILAGEGFSIYRARCGGTRVVIEVDPQEIARHPGASWRRRLDAVACSLGFTDRWLDARGYGGEGPPLLEPLSG